MTKKERQVPSHREVKMIMSHALSKGERQRAKRTFPKTSTSHLMEIPTKVIAAQIRRAEMTAEQRRQRRKELRRKTGLILFLADSLILIRGYCQMYRWKHFLVRLLNIPQDVKLVIKRIFR